MMDVHIDQTFTDALVERAIAACTDEHFAGDRRQMEQALLQRQSKYCNCVADYLAMHIGEYLGQVDKTVKAVFQYQPADVSQINLAENTSSRESFAGINLVAWVERKSAALSALVATIESLLIASQRDIGWGETESDYFVLDVRIVDNREVDQHRGLGLLVQNAYLHSKPVWSRVDTSEFRPPEDTISASSSSFELPDAFDPELIPESRLIDHALAIERIPPEERISLEPHLTELKVILIRRMISDQLAYINIAKRWFTIQDLADIHQHRIGYGRVGGKSAGMLLAARILKEIEDDELRTSLSTPESYFLGSDLIYIFMSMNGLMYWNDQKYKPSDQIYEEYPIIQEEFKTGSFPPEILQELEHLLEKIGKKPLIVRSSSQLEDNFGTSFAGKYDSYFCPNQGTPEENLAALTNAIASTYASTLKPEALLYRRSKGLQDYDERMAVLIQVVQGEPFGKYYLPTASGVASSLNIYRWSPQIQREDGFARLVWGLGTRAVQRLGDDYPRLVALSHPTLQPDDSTEALRHYSQHQVDLIDIETNELKTLPIHKVLSLNYPPLNLIAQVERDGFFVTPRMRIRSDELPKLAINYQEFLNRTNFAALLSKILRLLEKNYHSAIDLEFTVYLPEPHSVSPHVHITLLQCRPQSYLEDIRPPMIPDNLAEQDILFSTNFMVPRGYLANIRYVLFVKPDAYFSLPTRTARNQISQTIARLNSLLEEKSFICIGPGRWGSINMDLGVYVSYADIHNAAALIELSGRGIGTGPEPSLGTHFYQDLMEAQIYPLAIPLDGENSLFNRELLYGAPNSIQNFLTVDQTTEECMQLINVSDYRPGSHVELIMDDERSRAIAFVAG